jgi:hypothetical protein
MAGGPGFDLRRLPTRRAYSSERGVKLVTKFTSSAQVSARPGLRLVA